MSLKHGTGSDPRDPRADWPGGQSELDSTHGPEFIDNEGQLAKYRAQLDAAQELALAPPASRDFIQTLAHDL